MLRIAICWGAFAFLALTNLGLRQSGSRESAAQPSAAEDLATKDSAAKDPGSANPDQDELVWQTDYAEAMRLAKAQRKMMLIYFQAAESNPLRKQFEAVALADPKIRELLRKYVVARLPLDVRIPVAGQPIKVLEHAAFADMQSQQGIAIIDFVNENTEHYGHVVTALPFVQGKYYHFQPTHLGVVLDLPAGTLTQRTMVFAVRIHPEGPASTKGEIDPVLAAEAKSHSTYQAQIHVQGHHHWDHRFHRISRRLPLGLRAQEVVAESWPDEGLLDAAVDCVHSWRQSSGHWSAVRRRQPRFGYDMKRGSNGIWYATGLFGNR